jgi:hypothetical protein
MWITTKMLILALASLLASNWPADARGGHHGGFGHHGGGGFTSSGMRGSALAGDRQHANNDYVKAASQE